MLDELTTGLDPEARRDTWRLIEGVRDRGVTIVLVTHLMEEAERLCDRVALIDRGRVIALDRPAALGERASASQRIRLRTPGTIGEAILHGLPEVSRVERHGQDIVVSGIGDLCPPSFWPSTAPACAPSTYGPRQQISRRPSSPSPMRPLMPPRTRRCTDEHTDHSGHPS